MSTPALAASWSSPMLVDASGTALPSVSCPFPTFCMAVDGTGQALTYNGTVWSAPTDIDGSTPLESVSCNNYKFCMAVDVNGHAVSFNGSTWRAPVGVDGSRLLESVSCASLSFFCAAVDEQGSVVTFNRSATPQWSAPDDIDGTVAITSVSCRWQTFCMAVDQTGNAFTDVAGVWSQDRIGTGNGLQSVSCPTATFCMAVDDLGDALGYTNGTWGSPTDVDGSNGLSSLACLSTTFCVAVDEVGNALAYIGSSWSTPVPMDSNNWVRAISCGKTSLCVAVDNSGNAVVFSNPVQVTTSSLPPATVSSSYTTTLTASGGNPPYRWMIASGSLPPGLLLKGATGVISGTPDRAGLYEFSVRAIDQPTQTFPNFKNSATQSLSIAVDQGPAFVSGPRDQVSIGISFSFTVKTKGYPVASLTETGNLPGGVTFTDNGNGTATLAGTPMPGSGGTYSLALTATSTIGTANQTFDLVVD
jgi:hypothetical protein